MTVPPDPTVAPARPRGRRRLALAVQATGVVLCLAAVVWVVRGVDVHLLSETLGRVTLPPLILAVTLNVTGQLTRAAGWRVLLGLAHRLPGARLVQYEFAAQAVTAITPEGSGEALRLWWLSREGVPPATTTAIIAARKLMSSLGLVPFVVVLPWTADLPVWCVWLVAAYSGLLVALLAVLLVFLHRRQPYTEPAGGRVRRLARKVLDGLTPLREGRVLAASFGLACTTRATDLAAAWIVTASLGLPTGYAAAVLPLLLIEVSNALPTAPAQIGSFEAGAASAVRLLGGSATDSVAFAVLFHAQQVLPQIVAGLVPLWAVSTARRREATRQEQTK
ncbi:MAG TPA: lysylphosphatidylglycerol synthase transmembrane domain-containing protein [Mycobacteriales bacterium]|nr:lysylphosphatidylglycerol synthase transmembrane domain-containing protein [Mycobacteriales bacterium]